MILIDANKLIEEFEQRRGYAMPVSMVIDIINNQAVIDAKETDGWTPLKVGWIPCSKKFSPNFYPIKGKEVSVTIEDGKGERFTSTAKWHEEYGIWCEFASTKFYGEEFKVVAWQALPEPYKGE